MNDRTNHHAIFAHCLAPDSSGIVWGIEQFRPGHFRDPLISEVRRSVRRGRCNDLPNCRSTVRPDLGTQEIQLIENGSGQNRAVALRERTITGSSAMKVYGIIKGSSFLKNRPELKDRLAKAFDHSDE